MRDRELPAVTVTCRHDYRVDDPELLLLHGWRLAHDDPEQAAAYGLVGRTSMSPHLALRLVIAATPVSELAETAGEYGLTLRSSLTSATAESTGTFIELEDEPG